jgi:hypothetical protein
VLLENCRPKLHQESKAGPPISWGFDAITDLDLELRVLLGAFDRSRQFTYGDFEALLEELRHAEEAEEEPMDTIDDTSDHVASSDNGVPSDHAATSDHGDTHDHVVESLESVGASAHSEVVEEKDDDYGQDEQKPMVQGVREEWGLVEASAAPGFIEPERDSDDGDDSEADRELREYVQQVSLSEQQSLARSPGSTALKVAARDKEEVENLKTPAARRQSSVTPSPNGSRRPSQISDGSGGRISGRPSPKPGERRGSTIARELLLRPLSADVQQMMDEQAASLIATHDELTMVEALKDDEQVIADLVQQFKSLDETAQKKRSWPGHTGTGQASCVRFKK